MRVNIIDLENCNNQNYKTSFKEVCRNLENLIGTKYNENNIMEAFGDFEDMGKPLHIGQNNELKTLNRFMAYKPQPKGTATVFFIQVDNKIITRIIY